MFTKTVTSIFLTLLLVMAQLEADSCYYDDGCFDGLSQEIGRQGCCGLAYEESIYTPKLIATFVIGTIAVTLIAVALVNTPANHGHHCHDKRGCQSH